MEAKIAQKTHFCRIRATLIFAAIYSTLWPWSSQEQPKGTPKPHQKINRFSNSKKSPQKLPMAPKRVPN